MKSVLLPRSHTVLSGTHRSGSFAVEVGDQFYGPDGGRTLTDPFFVTLISRTVVSDVTRVDVEDE